MSDERLRTRAELKRLFTGLRDKDITDEMMSIAIDSLWRDKLVQRTSGFEFPAHFDSEISFDSITRIFSIKPWDPLVEGFLPRYGIYAWTNPTVFNRIYDTLEIEIPNEEGLYCVYFDDEPGGTIQILFCKKNPTAQELETIYLSKVIISFLYWNAQNQSLIYFGDDRHGSEWNPQMQRYLHQSFAARRKTGLQFTNFELNGDGSNNNHLFLTISAGTILHDDIELEIPEAYGTIPILYFDNHLPRFLLSIGFAYYPGCNTDQIEITSLDSGNFVLYHYFATNEIGNSSRKIIAVMGIEQYTTLQAAYTANRAELYEIEKSMPMQGHCYIDSAIFQYSDDYTNDLKSRLVGFVSSLLQIGGGGESLFPDTITSETTNSETETKHTHKLGTILQDVVMYENKDFGYYYTFNNCIDAKGLSSSVDWVTPSAAQWIALRTFAGGYEVAGAKFKQTGNKNWLDPNNASNDYGFAAVGNGFCTTADTFFSLVGQVGSLWAFDSNTHNTEASVEPNPWSISFTNNSAGMWYSFLQSLHEGIGLRLCNPNTLLSEGQNGIYVGNNGVEYKTVVLNSIEWMCENLRETLWNDLTDMTYVAPGDDWNALIDTDSAYTRRTLSLSKYVEEQVKDLGKVKVSIDDAQADYLENKITTDGNLSFVKEADENGIETLRLNIAINEFDFHIQFIDNEDYAFIVPFACQLTNISYSAGLSPDFGTVQIGHIFSQYDELPIVPGGTGLLTLTFNNDIQQGGVGD